MRLSNADDLHILQAFDFDRAELPIQPKKGVGQAVPVSSLIMPAVGVQPTDDLLGRQAEGMPLAVALGYR